MAVSKNTQYFFTSVTLSAKPLFTLFSNWKALMRFYLTCYCPSLTSLLSKQSFITALKMMLMITVENVV